MDSTNTKPQAVAGTPGASVGAGFLGGHEISEHKGTVSSSRRSSDASGQEIKTQGLESTPATGTSAIVDPRNRGEVRHGMENAAGEGRERGGINNYLHEHNGHKADAASDYDATLVITQQKQSTGAELTDGVKSSNTTGTRSDKLGNDNTRGKDIDDTGATAAGNRTSNANTTSSGTSGDADKDSSHQGKENVKGHLEHQSGMRHENPDRIPTAGGQKLGSKHWGESKVVKE